MIHSTLSADAPFLHSSLTVARLLARADNATFASVDSSTGDAVVVASAALGATGLRNTRFSRAQGVAGMVVATGEPILLDDPGASPRFRRLGERPVNSIVAVPVLQKGTTRGVLTVTSAQRERFGLTTVEELRAVADQISAGLVLAPDASCSRQLQELAHDLGSPLSTARGFLQLLREGGAVLSSAQQEMLELVATSVEQLALIAGDMRDVLHLSRDRLQLRLSSVDPAALVQEVVRGLGPLARESEVVLHCAVGSAVPRIQADRQRLHRVLGNVLSNAIKYTGPGGRVQVEVCAGADGGIRVTVDDEGPGIAEAELARLFEAHYQGSILPPRGADGVGLGLAIACSLAAAHGGRLAAENRPERGARFVLTLPARPPADEAAPQETGGVHRPAVIVAA